MAIFFSFIRSASGDSSTHDDEDHFWLDEFDASRNMEADGGQISYSSSLWDPSYDI